MTDVGVEQGHRGSDGVVVSTATLTGERTRTNYGTQTVTVTGVQDADASDESTSIALSASGADYGGLRESVSVTVTIDDERTHGVWW